MKKQIWFVLVNSWVPKYDIFRPGYFNEPSNKIFKLMNCDNMRRNFLEAIRKL